MVYVPTQVKQVSFSSGEISPSLHQRFDTAQHASGLKTARNVIVVRHGGIKSRPGFKYVGQAKNLGDETVRFVPHQISADVSYVIAFGDGYLNFIRNEDYVYDKTFDISQILNTAVTVGSNTAVEFVLSASHGMSVGDVVKISDHSLTDSTNILNGDPFLVNREFVVASISSDVPSDPARCYLKTKAGVVVTNNQIASFSAFSPITMKLKRVYSISTGISKSSGALDEFNFSKDDDALIVAHHTFRPKRIVFNSDSDWLISDVTFDPEILGPSGNASNPSNSITNSASLVSGPTKNATGMFTNGVSGVMSITSSAAHGLSVNDIITMSVSYTGTTAFKVASVSGSTNFSITVPVTGVLVNRTGTFNKLSPDIISTLSSASVINRYKITAISGDNYEESLPFTYDPVLMSAFSSPSSGVVTFTTTDDHKLYIGDVLYITGITSSSADCSFTFMNDNYYTVLTVPTAKTFTISVPNFDASPVYDITNFGGFTKDYFIVGSSSEPSASNRISISWNAVEGASEYNIYKAINGFFGKVGVSVTPTFIDYGTIPDLTDSTPIKFTGFQSEDNYPAVVASTRQRRIFANTVNAPSAFQTSRATYLNNFAGDSPLREDSPISGKALSPGISTDFNEILHIIDAGQIIFMTSTGEFTLTDISNGKAVPQIKQGSMIGSSRLSPLVADSTVLFVQSKGSIIRNLDFDYQVDGYRGNDLTIFSSHLVDGHRIISWAYQKTPHSLVYCVREDGVMIVLTYVRDQNVFAWTRHDTAGLFKYVTCISENNEDVIYAAIQRTINGQVITNIEKLTSFSAPEIEDACIIRTEKNYTNVGNISVTFSGGTTWGPSESITCAAASSLFKTTDIGKRIIVHDGQSRVLSVTISARTSGTVVTCTPNITIPSIYRGVAITNWKMATNTVRGLWALEGKSVSIVGDFDVVANPNNASIENVYTVSNGTVTLPSYYNNVRVGLPYNQDVELLDIDSVQQTVINKKKTVGKVSLHLEESKGLFVGGQAPLNELVNDSVSKLTQLKIRDSEDYSEPTNSITGVHIQNIVPLTTSHGRIFIRQSDPLPMTILAVSREVSIT